MTGAIWPDSLAGIPGCHRTRWRPWISAEVPRRFDPLDRRAAGLTRASMIFAKFTREDGPQVKPRL
jgi:hypothetical protein